MRHAIHILFVLLSVGVVAHAQPREMKLSPVEPVIYALPDSLRIQAADRYGDLTLAVWGSNLRLADSSYITGLWAQLLRDSIAIGAPFRITRDDARPAHAVAVSASRDRFVVVWNDVRRDAPGIYSEVIDTRGALLHDASLISPLRTTTHVFMLARSADDEFVLVWSAGSGAAHRIRSQTLTNDGRSIGGVSELGTNMTRVRRMTPSIDGWLLHVDKAKWFAVGHGVNRVREVTAPVCEPFVVRDDGSAITICSDSIREYSSLFDASLVRQVRVPTAQGLPILVATPSLAGDTTLILGFTRRDSSKVYMQRFVRVSLDSALAVTAEVVVHASTDQPSAYGIVSIEGSHITLTGGCNNAYRITATLKFMVYGYHGRHEEELRTRHAMIDGNGGARVGGDTTIGVCPNVPMSRVVSNVASVVRIYRDTATVATASRPINIIEQAPALDVSGETVMLAWTAGYNHYFVHHWSRYDDTVTVRIDSLYPPRIVYDSPRISDQSGYMLSEVTYHSSGQATMAVDHFRVESRTTPGGNYDPWYYNYYACHTLTGGGWVRTVLTEGGGDWFLMDIEPGRHSHDPDEFYTTGQYGVASTGGNINKHVVFTLDSRGGLVESFPSARALGAHVLYDRPGQYLDCGPSQVRALTKDTAYTIMRFDDSATGVWYQKLLRRHLLRAWKDSRDSTILHVERYDLDGARVGATEIRLNSKHGTFVYAEANDGRLFVVHADTGVFVYAFDPTLTMYASDVRISGPKSRAFSPSAAVVGDTLLVVWEDRRGDAPDIYGASLNIDAIQSRAVPEPTHRVDLVATTTPIPANDHILVTLREHLPTAAYVALHDVNGNLCARDVIQAGGMQARLMVRGCPSGMYQMSISAGDRSQQTRVVIVR